MKLYIFKWISAFFSYRKIRVLLLTLAAWLVVYIYYNNIVGLMNNFQKTSSTHRYEVSDITAEAGRSHLSRDPRSSRPSRGHSTQSSRVVEDFLIDTPGCRIPNYAKTLHFNETISKIASCGTRAVFVNMVPENKIQFYIDEGKMQVYSKKVKYSCCCQFVSRSNVSGKEDLGIRYSACTVFSNGTKLYPEEEVIIVKCFTKKNKKINFIYRDAYIVIKKITKTEKTNEKLKKWNVILLGMDTMSRARVYDSMPKTTQYLKRHGWLDFRAYNKVGYNTFPNVIAFLTGLNQNNLYNVCDHEQAKDKNIVMWTKFKSQGYVTAFGEDFLTCPDTFSSCTRINKPFKTPPTDHYMRPLFLTGERSVSYLICTEKLSSVEHLLNYAFDFANTYKEEQFFAFFWMNSFSHGLECKPPQIDAQVTDLFLKLNRTGILENTFVVFFGDHGNRYGAMRYKVETYFEDRLPMFFIWLPDQFREMYPEATANAITNQHRLSSPYDLYSTLVDILRLSNTSVEKGVPEGCAQCSSVFVEKSGSRTCEDAGVAEKWCTCHQLKTVTDAGEYGAKRAVASLLTSLNNKMKLIQTIDCTKCSNVTLHQVLRIHSHVKNGKTYYVIALIVKPTSLAYEGTVVMNKDTFNVINSGDAITMWSKGGLGKCAVKFYDRAHCSCQKTKCKKKKNT